MAEKHPIDRLKIQGFMSLQDVDLELGKLNVLIGPNGAGKSNLISYFRMLREMVEGRLQLWVAKRGGANRLLFMGAKQTPELRSKITIGESYYEFGLQPTDDERFVFGGEHTRIVVDGEVRNEQSVSGGQFKSNCLTAVNFYSENVYIRDFYSSITNAIVYHFHDTSESAPVKKKRGLHEYQYLHHDASNLAAYLFKLREFHPDIYNNICKIIRLALPFFDDFILNPEKTSQAGYYPIQLMWRQKGSRYIFLPSQLSDGSLRFISLVTALLKPDPPSTIIIDEPELGLHPYAIHLLGALLRSASLRMQVIVATQSSLLLDEFCVDDLIVVELQSGASVFKRLEEAEFTEWLHDFSVGELWYKNVIGGGIP